MTVLRCLFAVLVLLIVSLCWTNESRACNYSAGLVLRSYAQPLAVVDDCGVQAYATPQRVYFRQAPLAIVDPYAGYGVSPIVFRQRAFFRDPVFFRQRVFFGDRLRIRAPFVSLNFR